MKSLSAARRAIAFVRWMLPFALAFAITSMVSAQTSSQRRIVRPDGFERVPSPPADGANRIIRTAPTQAPSQVTRTIIYPTRYGRAESSYTVATPQKSVPMSRPEVSTPAVDGRSRLSLPVSPATMSGRVPPPQATPSAPASRELPMNVAPEAAPLTSTKPGIAEVTVKKPVLPPVPDFPEYGVPVPGRKGCVYPPGVDKSSKYIVDVVGLAAGEKVRDPRTGVVFLVPPQW